MGEESRGLAINLARGEHGLFGWPNGGRAWHYEIQSTDVKLWTSDSTFADV